MSKLFTAGRMRMLLLCGSVQLFPKTLLVWLFPGCNGCHVLASYSSRSNLL